MENSICFVFTFLPYLQTIPLLGATRQRSKGENCDPYHSGLLTTRIDDMLIEKRDFGFQFTIAFYVNNPLSITLHLCTPTPRSIFYVEITSTSGFNYSSFSASPWQVIAHYNISSGQSRYNLTALLFTTGNGSILLPTTFVLMKDFSLADIYTFVIRDAWSRDQPLEDNEFQKLILDFSQFNLFQGRKSKTYLKFDQDGKITLDKQISATNLNSDSTGHSSNVSVDKTNVSWLSHFMLIATLVILESKRKFSRKY